VPATRRTDILLSMNQATEKERRSHLKRSFVFHLMIPLALFFTHLSLTTFHTYYSASKQATVDHSPHPHVRNPVKWHRFLDLNRWDSAHYETIVKHGYRKENEPSKPRFAVIWYPGYPLIAKAVWKLTNWKVTAVFSLLSFLFTLSLWFLLWSKTSLLKFGPKTLGLTSAFLLCWPGSFYWFAGMTEPLAGLISIALVIFWIKKARIPALVLLAYSTSVKPTLVPFAITYVVLDYFYNRPKERHLWLNLIAANSGFLLYGVYCWYNFGSFFTSVKLNSESYNNAPSISSVFDPRLHAEHIFEYKGLIATSVLVYLLFELLYFFRKRGLRDLRLILNRKSLDFPITFVLWALTINQTLIFIYGQANNSVNPLNSMMRYHTPVIPLFLLLGIRLRPLKLWQLLILGIPCFWILIYWQNEFAVRYWNFRWVD